jgi:hypothetical protein
MKMDVHKYCLPIMQATAFCVFAGRGWQYLFFDTPYRELLWDVNWMKGIVENFTPLTWDEYVTSPAVDLGIQRLITGTGWLYIICAFVALFYRRLPRSAHFLLLFGAANLVLLAGLYLKEYFFHAGQFFEYALQFGAPVFLFAVRPKEAPPKPLWLWMKICVSLTFICHGLYAVGYYPRPGTFLTMTIQTLRFSEPTALAFLNIAGALDFFIALGIFLPARFARFFLIYAAFWGLLTSLARITGNFYWEFPMESLFQWFHECVYRLPHFFIPFLLVLKSNE